MVENYTNAFHGFNDEQKCLACVDIYHLIPFLHIIINRLLILLVSSPSDEVALNTLNVLVVIVDRVAENKSRHEILRDFVYYHLRYIVSIDTEESTHSALVKYLPMLIRTVQGDNKAVASIFRQLWFFVDCIVKCMAQWLIRNKMFKTPRRDRFPTEVLYRVEGFVQFVTTQIIHKHKDLPVESRQANLSLANFLKYCLSLTDRYAIMNQIHYAVEKLDQNSSRSLRVFKLELLQVLCGHEHWLPYVYRCSPIKTGVSGGLIAKFFAQIFSTTTAILESTEADRYANYVEHFYLSSVYCQTHFLSGIVFQELAAALRDPREYRRQVIQLMRNLLAKHSADTRYTDSSAQNRIAMLYTPVIRLVIENIRELEATAKVSAESPNLNTDNSSLLSSSLGISKNLRSSTTKAATLPSDTSNAPSQNPASIATFSEKLDKTEARDLILCVLYVLNKLPKKTVGALCGSGSQTSSTNVYLDFIRVLELALFMFRYRGRSYHVREQAKRQRSSMKTLVNFQTSERSCTMDSHLSSSTASSGVHNILNVDEEAIDGSIGQTATSSMSFLQDCHLTQEVALIVLEVCQTLANQIATRAKQLNSDTIDMAFKRLLDVEIQLLSPSWPENVRLHALAGLAVFINLILPKWTFGVLVLLDQSFAAATQLQICQGPDCRSCFASVSFAQRFDVASAHYCKHLDSNPLSADNTNPSLATERLGRPGSQTGVALADLLSHKPVLLTPGSSRFERGLSALESLVQNHGEKRISLFEKGVLELIKQLRGFWTPLAQSTRRTMIL
uniref:Uncharacterized protein n=1 Tax=Ditylenchus dipsaci TaxID=166011 RepID=A0A915EU26_9BILA